jgi:hypothetical protein
MKRFLLVVVIAAASGLGGLGACNKPQADDCRKALLNMQALLGTSAIGKGAVDIEGEVRMCKGGSTKESVACAENATTLDQLKACGFMTAKPAAK